MPRLTEMSTARPGLARWVHGLARLPPLGRVLRAPRSTILFIARALVFIGPRLVARLWDTGLTMAMDWYDARRPQPSGILRIEEGEEAAFDSRSVALFVTFSPQGGLSEMVRRQVEAYRQLGFAVVILSNSPVLPEKSWQEARRLAALVIHRRNSGLDFGAWKEVLPLALNRWPEAEEVLLVNDSVLGPIRPLEPVLATMRDAGEGFFGLLESIQGGPHLQSWFTLARGRKAVADLADFLAQLRLSRSKWMIIQRGELRMSQAMRRAGNRVAAVFDYAGLVDMALRDPAMRPDLHHALHFFRDDEETEVLRRWLMGRPVNPAHSLWRVMAAAGCPFIKTELVRRNPGGLPGVEDWPDYVPPDSPVPVAVLREHLRELGP